METLPELGLNSRTSGPEPMWLCGCQHTHSHHTYMHTYMLTYIHTYIHTHTCMHACIHTYVHTYIHTHTHLQPLVVIHILQSQYACALSRHCEPCKQSSWSQARNSQENRPFLTACGVGTQSPTCTIAVS